MFGNNSTSGKQRRLLLGELHTRMAACGHCSADRTGATAVPARACGRLFTMAPWLYSGAQHGNHARWHVPACHLLLGCAPSRQLLAALSPCPWAWHTLHSDAPNPQNMSLFDHQVSACWPGLRTEYLPTLRQALTKPLVELEKEGIQPVVSLMQASLCFGCVR